MGNETHDEDYDEPWADPSIKGSYESVLGEFLVVFNHIENTISESIFLALDRMKRNDIKNLFCGDHLYSRKLANLALISLAVPRIASSSLISELRALGIERNNLAHGHFDQNPFDGSYSIVTARKRFEMPVDEIRLLTKRANAACDELRHSQTPFYFDVLDSPSDKDEASEG